MSEYFDDLNNLKNLPAVQSTQHPDIKAELDRLPFTPQRITHDGPPVEELKSNAEFIHACACQLQNALKDELTPSEVCKVTDATLKMLKARREMLNIRHTNVDDNTIPIKPPVRPII